MSYPPGEGVLCDLNFNTVTANTVFSFSLCTFPMLSFPPVTLITSYDKLFQPSVTGLKLLANAAKLFYWVNHTQE